MNETDQQREHRIISYLITAIANICLASPNQIIDRLIGMTWDEEEAGKIKMANTNDK